MHHAIELSFVKVDFIYDQDKHHHAIEGVYGVQNMIDRLQATESLQQVLLRRWMRVQRGGEASVWR